MTAFFLRFLRLWAGLFCFSFGIVLSLNANIGYAPWDVFHAGISRVTGLSFGAASILAGLAVVAAVMLCKEKIGIGTILNMLVIGVNIDLIRRLRLLPVAEDFISGVFLLIVGLFVIALASYLYLSSAFGAGPRDSLMVVLTKKTALPVGLCRSFIEIGALTAGWLLGGMAGAGTVISAFGIGFCIQLIFRLFRFDASLIRHESLSETGRHLYGLYRQKRGR